jgi:hypothetical protein
MVARTGAVWRTPVVAAGLADLAPEALETVTSSS